LNWTKYTAGSVAGKSQQARNIRPKIQTKLFAEKMAKLEARAIVDAKAAAANASATLVEAFEARKKSRKQPPKKGGGGRPPRGKNAKSAAVNTTTIISPPSP
jgi:hypothetical protein